MPKTEIVFASGEFREINFAFLAIVVFYFFRENDGVRANVSSSANSDFEIFALIVRRVGSERERVFSSSIK